MDWTTAIVRASLRRMRRRRRACSTPTPGAPMLVLGRHSVDSSGEPVEWVTSWHRGDRVTFVANLSSPRP